MHSISVQHTPHTIPPDRLRVAVLGRRVRLPAATAALVAELAYGTVYREQADVLPIAFSGREFR